MGSSKIPRGEIYFETWQDIKTIFSAHSLEEFRTFLSPSHTVELEAERDENMRAKDFRSRGGHFHIIKSLL